jgi:transcriptional regulator with XRE-family HTH domain
MDNDPGPAVQRIVLGEELRELREAAGLSSDDAASALGWYRAKISKVETGAAKLTHSDVARLIEAYGIPSDRQDQLKRLAREAARRLQPARVPDFAAKYVNLEGSAVDVKTYHGDIVPGMLQTKDYATALLETSVIIPTAEIDQMAEDRVVRAERFASGIGPLLWVVLGEEALLRQVGGPDVIRGQLRRLKMMARLPNVTLQVMPLAKGAHAALGVSFTILELGSQRRSIVYLESLTSADYLPRPHHVRTYGLVFGRLQAAALSQEDSLAMLDRLIDKGSSEEDG